MAIFQHLNGNFLELPKLICIHRYMIEIEEYDRYFSEKICPVIIKSIEILCITEELYAIYVPKVTWTSIAKNKLQSLFFSQILQK